MATVAFKKKENFRKFKCLRPSLVSRDIWPRLTVDVNSDMAVTINPQSLGSNNTSIAFACFFLGLLEHL